MAVETPAMHQDRRRWVPWWKGLDGGTGVLSQLLCLAWWNDAKAGEVIRPSDARRPGDRHLALRPEVA